MIFFPMGSQPGSPKDLLHREAPWNKRKLVRFHGWAGAASPWQG